MKREWTIIAVSIGVTAAAAVVAPLVPGPPALSREFEAHREFVRLRDPDKSRFYFSSLRNVGSNRTFWFGTYGDTLVHVSTVDGIETYQVDQWEALEGPDRIKCRLSVRFREMTALGFEIAPVASGARC
ncbi:MAG TPA: hypothetical protein VJT13_00795 [Xanthobacteraceae bacterium]|nr:hypothetical protein [Xanthobacteraceae bacterium]